MAFAAAADFVQGKPLRSRRIERDLAIFERRGSAQALGVYMRRVVPRADRLLEPVVSRVDQIATGYGRKGELVKEGILRAHLSDFDCRYPIGSDAYPRLIKILDILLQENNKAAVFSLVQESLEPLSALKLILLVNFLEEQKLTPLIGPVCNLLRVRNQSVEFAEQKLRELGARQDTALMSAVLLQDWPAVAQQAATQPPSSAVPPEILEKAGRLQEAEAAYREELLRGNPEGYVRLFQFYQRTGLLGVETNSYLQIAALSATHTLDFEFAYLLFDYLRQMNGRYPKGNPPGEEELPNRRQIMDAAYFGMMRCLFLEGDIEKGLRMLRQLENQ